MKKMVISFTDLLESERSAAGGKGGTLSRLYQSGMPVPDGFIIMPSAFDQEDLHDEAWSEIQKRLNIMRQGDPEIAFAVRSSALAEDSAYASFAGEFETVLDVRTDQALRAAILQVHSSRLSDRVKAYSQAKGITEEQEIAIVIQRLIRADISGILFTADPVTSDLTSMPGNFVYGFGEELVAGEVEPFTFSFKRANGTYAGPSDLKPYAKRLYRLAVKLETDLECPQDIEWALADGQIYILQSRPITTLIDYDPVKCEWNTSFTGDYAWVSSEVFTDTMTPASWSIWKKFQNVDEVFGVKAIGNICGHFYMNMSFAGAMIKLTGKDLDYLTNYVKLTTGFDLRKIEIPELPVSRWNLIKFLIPLMMDMLPKQLKLMKRHEEILKDNVKWCEKTRELIKSIEDKSELAEMWLDELWPVYWDLLQLQDKSNEDYFLPFLSVRENLISLVGKERAEALLANLVGESGDLSSLGQLHGLQQLADGEISPEDYLRIAGHRPPSENEISTPRFYEDPDWINKQLADYKKNTIDYRKMGTEKRKKFKQVWDEFAQDYPKQSKKIWAGLEKTINGMEKRERIRSELTRALGVFRDWFLRAGELTSLGDDVFYLQNEEVQQLLKGEDCWLEIVAPRKEAYQRHLALPTLPMMISGRFDPYTWEKDPNRRSDYYDAHKPMPKRQESDLVQGLPGSAGQVEGTVRIIHSPAQINEFQIGEILVAPSTNVGWTPLFPRATAVITDIGAPLSHAAIVARELGIPAVVGTGNSSSVLKTGDRVRVDGSHGIVEILEKPN